MKKILIAAFFMAVALWACAQGGETIKLPSPDMERSGTVMDALANRKSTREYSPAELSVQDLSDLLWAANGINRADEGKRTAPSARNRQDVHLYVSMAGGTYLYDAASHELRKISNADVRGTDAPVCILIAVDTDDAMTGVDAGVVSQNISIFCASANLGTVCRGGFPNKEQVEKDMNITEGHRLLLNHPVGYFK